MDEQKTKVTEELTETAPEKIFCVKCSAELSEGQTFCPKCGHQVGAKLKASNPKRKIVFAAIGVVAAIIAVVVGILAIRGKQATSVTLNKDSITLKVDERQSLSFTIDPSDTKDQTVTWSSSNESIAKVNNGVVSGINEGDCTITITTKNGKTDTCSVIVIPAGPDLQAIYDEYCTSSFAEIASDGSYLSVDTNPSDRDDYMDYEAYLAIVSINTELELPESVLNKMNQTRSMDGIQSYSTDELEITWTYHPDRGLEVNYSLK
mgnify:CR=1 FL=1